MGRRGIFARTTFARRSDKLMHAHIRLRCLSWKYVCAVFLLHLSRVRMLLSTASFKWTVNCFFPPLRQTQVRMLVPSHNTWSCLWWIHSHKQVSFMKHCSFGLHVSAWLLMLHVIFMTFIPGRYILYCSFLSILVSFPRIIDRKALSHFTQRSI